MVRLHFWKRLQSGCCYRRVSRIGPRISLVVSSDADAPGLAKARRAGLSTLVVPKVAHEVASSAHSQSVRQKIDWVALDRELRSVGIDAIFLLGFMRIVPASFLNGWKGRVLNLHPSLLPSFPGLRSIERAIEARAPLGATVHIVEPEVDAGPIVKQTPAASHECGELAEFHVHCVEQILVRQVFRGMKKETFFSPFAEQGRA